MPQILGGIKLDANVWEILRDFPKIIVHEVWVGNIVTPVSVVVPMPSKIRRSPMLPRLLRRKG